MKRTLLIGILTLAVISVFSLTTHTDTSASTTAGSASLLPWFSVTILNGTTSVPGAKVTISGPSGTSQQNSDANGQVCTSHGYGTVRVSWTSGQLSGCRDINHQSQTVCATNPYTVSNGSYCDEQ